MSAIAATAERQDASFFAFSSLTLRETQVALRGHQGEVRTATEKVERATAAADNLRNQLATAEAAAEAAKAALVDQRTASLLAEQGAAAYGAEADPRDKKLRVTAERNHLDATVSAEATQRALAVAENAVREAQSELDEVRSQGTALVLAELAEQHRELLERLREARQTLGAAEADAAGLAMAVAERGREMYDAGYGTSWFQLAEKMNIAFSEQSHAEASTGNRAHAARAWAGKIVRLLAGGAE